MNERTNKPSRPIVVGFGSVPGGTGCTTLAIHAATYAARQGLHTLAISIDPSADMLRRLGCDEPRIDDHWTKEKRLKLAFVPPEPHVYDVVDYLPNLGFGGKVGNPEIIFLDMGPGVISEHVVRADFWVVPIQDSRSLESLAQRTFPLGIYQTLFVLSRMSFNTSRRLRQSSEYLQVVNREEALLLRSDIPSSGLLRRTASECKTIWELTSSSLTTRKVEWFCHELLLKVGLEERTPEIRRAEDDANDALLPFDDDELPSELALATAPPLSDEKKLQETDPPTHIKMTDFQATILSAADGETAYRLVQERAGALYYVPSLDMPPLSLSPFVQPVVPPGHYGVADAKGNLLGRPRPSIVWVKSPEELRAGVETNPPTQDKPNHKQEKLNRRITHGFERELARLSGTGVVPKASRRKKRA